MTAVLTLHTRKRFAKRNAIRKNPPRRNRKKARISSTQTTSMKKVSMIKKAFEKEHKHLVKVLKKGTNKEQEKEGEEQSKELEREKEETIKGAKSMAMEDKKDNYEKKPSAKLKKKRSTSDGYMTR